MIKLFTTLIFSIFLFENHIVHSQTMIDNPFISYEKEGSYILNIFFMDSSKNTINIFNVIDNNPYNKLNFTVENEKLYYNNVYRLENIRMSNLLTNPVSSDYLFESVINEKVKMVFSWSSVASSEDRKILVVFYQLSAITENNGIGVESTIFILDDKGIIINRLDNININILDIAITIDGKYLFIKYGLDDERGREIFKYGYRIYNLQTNRIILDKKEDMGGFISQNLLIIGKEYWEDSILKNYVEVYDFYNKKKYSATFLGAAHRVLELNSKGYKIKLDNKMKPILFEKDYKVENLTLE